MVAVVIVVEEAAVVVEVLELEFRGTAMDKRKIKGSQILSHSYRKIR